MDTKFMPGRHRKKSKSARVQLVHYSPCSELSSSPVQPQKGKQGGQLHTGGSNTHSIAAIAN